MPEGSGIGAAVRRVEDDRFLRGKGRYVDDINRPDQVYASFLRSPHAHATIKSISVDTAKAAPGVVAVFTGADLEAAGVGGLICGWTITQPNGETHKAPKHPVIAVGKVRHVGEVVAMVVAESQAQAKDAAELIEVDYEELAPSIALDRTFDEGAAQVHDDAPGNLCYDWEIGDKTATDAAFARAHHVAKLDLVNNRLIPNPIEPRAAIAEYDEATGDYTFFVTSQNPHVARLIYTAFIGIAPENKIRIIAPDVGGGFGSKIYTYSEDTAVLWASKAVGRPIKWTGDRSEAFLTDAHARDHVTHAELALGCGWHLHRPALFHQGQHGRLSAGFFHGCAQLSLWLSLGRPVPHPGDLLRCQGRASPTPDRWTPTAAPGGRKPPSWSSVWWTLPRGSWASIRLICGGATSSRRRPFLTRHRC